MDLARKALLNFCFLCFIGDRKVGVDDTVSKKTQYQERPVSTIRGQAIKILLNFLLS